MEAKEFRLDNYIYLHDSLHKVKLATLENLACNPKHNYKPVPLNEDWLKKFGFESDVENCYYLDLKGRTLEDEPFIYVNYNGADKADTGFAISGEMYEGSIGITLEYVHQLQNLFFALTGKELTL